MCPSAEIKYMPGGKEEIIMNIQKVQESVGSIFTAARLRKAAVCAVLAGFVAAGGAYWQHQRAEARSYAERQARTDMIAAQAEQRGVVLLDEAQVRAIAAQTAGKSEAELTFRAVYLTTKDHDDRDGRDGGKHRDGKEKHGRRDHRGTHPDDAHARDVRPLTPPAAAAQPADGAAAPPAQMQTAAEGAPMPMQHRFRPLYKVKCSAGDVSYKFYIDAVTGAVLSSKAEVDDDLF